MKNRLAMCVSFVVFLLFAHALGQGLTYTEAPMLKERVEAGQLPPVDERLPSNPLIVTPLDAIGNYGGTLERALTGVSDRPGFIAFNRASLLEWGLGEVAVQPGLAESFEIAEEGRVFRFHLRDGLHWSDGQPFTAADLEFYYQAVVLNPELSPTFPGWLTTGGVPGEIVKVDDLTVEFRFAHPYAFFPEMVAFHGMMEYLVVPMHYLSQFHPDYTSEEELAQRVRESGFDDWNQLFSARNEPFTNTELPVMRPWVVTQPFPAGRMIAERNPYYWKVDSAGQQLPYIDRIASSLIEDPNLIGLRAASGELDFQFYRLGFGDMPLFIDGAEQGNYRILRWPSDAGWVNVYTNQTHKDPGIREIMQNIEFRAALSHAINRDEMNELLFSGLGHTGHATANAADPYFVEGAGQTFASYDVERANQLLDSIGLDARDAEGYRLRPDGSRLQLSILTLPINEVPGASDAYELVVHYWNEVGIRTELELVEVSLFFTRAFAGDYDMVGNVTVSLLWNIDPGWWVPINPLGHYWAMAYGQWYATAGEIGEEPTGDIRQLQLLYDQMASTTDTDENIRLGQEIMRIHDENVWIIGTVELPFQPVIVNNDLFNVLEDGIASSRLQYEGFSWLEQVSFTNP